MTTPHHDKVKKAVKEVGEKYGRALKRLGGERHDSWEEKFEKKFRPQGYGLISLVCSNNIGSKIFAEKDIKSFIHSTLSTYKGELRKKLEMLADTPDQSWRDACVCAINLLDN